MHTSCELGDVLLIENRKILCIKTFITRFQLNRYCSTGRLWDMSPWYPYGGAFLHSCTQLM